MRNKSKLISSLPRLQPISVVDVETGEYLSKHEYGPSLQSLINYVTCTTRALYAEHSLKLHHDLGAFKGSANSFGRQKGYRIDYAALPKNVKAKSRIQELVLHKLISETVSYVNSPTQNKQSPTFASKINLGAVDAQMVRVFREPNSPSVFLQWKCWDKELLLEFTIPPYILKRTITKWSLPTVQIANNGEIVFYFSVQEEIPTRTGIHHAGVDLGVKELYTAAIINKTGARVADYHTSNRLKQLQRTNIRLVRERSFVRAKIQKYQAYGLDTAVLVMNQSRLSAKITRQGKNIALNAGQELARKLSKHDIAVLNVEELNWVSGTVSSEVGSNHSFQHARLQGAIEHANLRNGIRVRKVSARNTSQLCHSCTNTITHDTKKRSVYCGECKLTLDRDFNAAMNIAKTTPPEHGFVGRKVSGNTPYGEQSLLISSQSLLKNKPVPIRTLT